MLSWVRVRRAVLPRVRVHRAAVLPRVYLRRAAAMGRRRHE